MYICMYSWFQALRLPRALRLFDAIKRFMFKTIGDGSRLLVVLVLTLVFLMWFSVVSMQFFGYLEPKPECVITGADQFSNVLLVSAPAHGEARATSALCLCRLWSPSSSWPCRKAGLSS